MYHSGNVEQGAPQHQSPRPAQELEQLEAGGGGQNLQKDSRGTQPEKSMGELK